MRYYLLIVAFMMSAGYMSAQKIIYPETHKDHVMDTYFGVTVAEPYRWLENDTSKATVDWVKAQNKVTYGYLGKIPFRESLKKRLTEPHQLSEIWFAV